MSREISAGAVVFHRTGKKIKYLLLAHDADYWNFPKGQVDAGEEVKDTAEREIKEETGLVKIQFIGGFKETDKYTYQRDGQKIFKIVVFLLVQSFDKKVRLSFEHIDYQWLSYEEALKKLTFKNSQEILKKAHQYLVKTDRD